MGNSSFSVIVFDLGNVLIPFDYSAAIIKLNRIYPGLGDRFWIYYKQNYKLHRDFERGEIEEDIFILKMLEVLENRLNRQEFCEIYSKIFTENEEVTSLLPRLKQNYLLVLLSNTNSIHMEYGWKNFEFLHNFDKLILSHQVKSVKPEAKIYKAVEAYTQKPPREHLFIDDIEEYAGAARMAGWGGIRFENAAQLKRELREKGILF